MFQLWGVKVFLDTLLVVLRVKLSRRYFLGTFNVGLFYSIALSSNIIVFLFSSIIIVLQEWFWQLFILLIYSMKICLPIWKI
ncbi:hypothetical protein IC582_028327 [Cucumis melo]